MQIKEKTMINDELKKEVLLECEFRPAIIQIPSNTVALEITAFMLDEHMNINQAISKMGAAELAEARIDGEEWEWENVRWVLTDICKKKLEEMEHDS